MDFAAYQKAYFVDPQPEARFAFGGGWGITLFFEAYTAAVDYYSAVLGPPNYVEGEGTRGWRLGSGWLTLLQGQSGSPQNVEIPFVMATPEEAERLQAAFIAAGGTGDAPSDQLMYAPIRYCSVTDPFGTPLLIFAPLGDGGR